MLMMSKYLHSYTRVSICAFRDEICCIVNVSSCLSYSHNQFFKTHKTPKIIKRLFSMFNYLSESKHCSPQFIVILLRRVLFLRKFQCAELLSHEGHPIIYMMFMRSLRISKIETICKIL